MKNAKRIVSLLLIMIMTLAVFPIQAFAAGKILPDQNVAFTLQYRDGATSVAGAAFRIYKVADVDEYANMTLTEAFEPYKNTVAGLSDLDDQDQNSWLEMASTLKGYAQADALTPAAAGVTNESGILSVSLKPGLYLVFGYPATTPDFNTYAVVPFMAFLPGLNEELNEWNYDVTAAVKFEIISNEPTDDDFVTRKVLKVWDDSGYESVRPDSISVTLLQDGEEYETVTLNARNNWRYAWDNLPSAHDWTVIERDPGDYVVSIVPSGITFVVTNKYYPPITSGDPPVMKRITGDRPDKAGVFRFVMESLQPSNPMPIGSVNGRKVVQIRGAGSAEFGEITFTHAGVYEYIVYEDDGSLSGYTYDDTVYHVKYEVEYQGNELVCNRTITSAHGRPARALEFTNHYKAPGNRLPQTGMLWWPVPVLLLAGLFFIAIGVIRRRRNNG